MARRHKTPPKGDTFLGSYWAETSSFLTVTGVVAWDVAEEESTQIAANLVQRACLKELPPPHRLWQQPVPAAAPNPPRRQRQCNAWGDAGITAGGDGRAQILFQAKGIQRQPVFIIPFPTIKYRHDYPSWHFARKDEACEWVTAFVDWYNHRHRHSDIKFVTPHHRHSGAAKVICQQRAEVYKAARQANPTRWSRSTRYWLQPEEVWINKPPEENELALQLTLMQALSGSPGVTTFLKVTAISDLDKLQLIISLHKQLRYHCSPTRLRTFYPCCQSQLPKYLTARFSINKWQTSKGKMFNKIIYFILLLFH